jgi:hypothetical protein
MFNRLWAVLNEIYKRLITGLIFFDELVFANGTRKR